MIYLVSPLAYLHIIRTLLHSLSYCIILSIIRAFVLIVESCTDSHSVSGTILFYTVCKTIYIVCIRAMDTPSNIYDQS